MTTTLIETRCKITKQLPHSMLSHIKYESDKTTNRNHQFKLIMVFVSCNYETGVVRPGAENISSWLGTKSEKPPEKSPYLIDFKKKNPAKLACCLGSREPRVLVSAPVAGPQLKVSSWRICDLLRNWALSKLPVDIFFVELSWTAILMRNNGYISPTGGHT